MTQKAGAKAPPPMNFKDEAIEEEGVFGQSEEAAGGLLEASGFGAASNAAAKVEGKSAPSKTVAKQIRSAEHAGEQAEEAAASAIPSWGQFVLKVLVNTALIVTGLFLIVYGIMVAVRPRENAFSVRP